MAKEWVGLDIIRSEGEGFGLREMDPKHFLFLFWGRVQRKFEGELNTKHIEDIIPRVVEEMTEEERKLFDRNVKDQLGTNTGESVKSLLRDFLGEGEWEKLETLERDRIMEFDRHESEGVG